MPAKPGKISIDTELLSGSTPIPKRAPVDGPRSSASPSSNTLAPKVAAADRGADCRRLSGSGRSDARGDGGPHGCAGMARRVNRGEIWLLALPRPDKRRPVLVLSRQSLIGGAAYRHGRGGDLDPPRFRRLSSRSGLRTASRSRRASICATCSPFAKATCGPLSARWAPRRCGAPVARSRSRVVAIRATQPLERFAPPLAGSVCRTSAADLWKPGKMLRRASSFPDWRVDSQEIAPIQSDSGGRGHRGFLRSRNTRHGAAIYRTRFGGLRCRRPAQRLRFALVIRKQQRTEHESQKRTEGRHSEHSDTPTEALTGFRGRSDQRRGGPAIAPGSPGRPALPVRREAVGGQTGGGFDGAAATSNLDLISSVTSRNRLPRF